MQNRPPDEDCPPGLRSATRSERQLGGDSEKTSLEPTFPLPSTSRSACSQGRSAVLQRVPIAQRWQYVLDQQLVPGKHPVVPGEVVGMQHRTVRQHGTQLPRQTGLATRAMPVDRHDRRTRRTGQLDDSTCEVVEVDNLPIDGYQILTRLVSSSQRESESATSKAA